MAHANALQRAKAEALHRWGPEGFAVEFGDFDPICIVGETDGPGRVIVRGVGSNFPFAFGVADGVYELRRGELRRKRGYVPREVRV